MSGEPLTPEQIIALALVYKPVARFAMFSGGDGSLEATHWCINNIPDCEVLHINTGIGIGRTRQFVQDTCAQQGWRLTEIYAKEDCGQNYEEIVLKHGFPGPAGHQFMYRRLKERAVELIVRQRKTKRSDKVMLCTGIRHGDSQRRTGYGGREVNFRGAQMWVNPLYWVDSPCMETWSDRTGIPRNPVAMMLGMSGECLCGAFAKKGELAEIRLVDPSTADLIENLQHKVFFAGHDWGWEDRPPRKAAAKATPDAFRPMCVNCLKSERLLEVDDSEW